MTFANVYPTKIVILNCNLEDENIKKLIKALSVWDSVYFKYSLTAYFYDEYKKELTIPGGFSRNKLLEIIPDIKLMDCTDKKIKKRTLGAVSMKFPPRNDLQVRAIDFLIGNTDYSSGLTQKMLSLNTGEGKTYCAINYVVKTKNIPMIFVDQDSLGKQWVDSIKNFTNVEEDQIYFISGVSSINKLMKMTKKDLNKIKFFIAIHRTIKAHMDKNDENLTTLFSQLGIGVKIFDEAHLEFINTFSIDCKTNTESIYLTATPSRSNPVENYVYQRVFANVKKFSSNFGSDKPKNYHNIMMVKMNTTPNAKEQAKMMSKYGFSTNAYFNFIESPEKMDYFYHRIKTILKNAYKSKMRKSAIILHTLSSVETITSKIKEDFPDLKICRFDSSVPKAERNKVLEENDIIVTTDMSFSKGIDVKGLDICINTVPIVSKPKNEQMLGRLRRLDDKEVWYFDFVDAGVPKIVDILKMKQKLYTSKAKSIREWII